MDPSQIPIQDIATQAPTIGVLVWLLISARRTQREIADRFLAQLEKRDEEMREMQREALEVLRANAQVMAVVADRLKNAA